MRVQKVKRADPNRIGPEIFVADFFDYGVRYDHSGDQLAAQSRQCGFAALVGGVAQNERATVGGGHRLNARCEESADHHGGQNRDLGYQFGIHFHCLAPLGPGEFLLGVTVASALIQSTRSAKDCDGLPRRSNIGFTLKNKG